MHKWLKAFITVTLFTVTILTWYAIVHATDGRPTEVASFSSKDIIMILFGLLQTVFMGIGVWLIANDRELFTRLRIVEANQQTRDAVCDERHPDGDPHPQRRTSDKAKLSRAR